MSFKVKFNLKLLCYKDFVGFMTLQLNSNCSLVIKYSKLNSIITIYWTISDVFYLELKFELADLTTNFVYLWANIQLVRLAKDLGNFFGSSLQYSNTNLKHSSIYFSLVGNVLFYFYRYINLIKLR